MQTPHFAATRRDGVFRAVCFVARLAKGNNPWLRLASRTPSRKATVATVWDLIRGSLTPYQLPPLLRPVLHWFALEAAFCILVPAAGDIAHQEISPRRGIHVSGQLVLA